MNRSRLAEPTHSARLDVDDLPAAECDHVGCPIAAGDRLIEADGGSEPFLELGVLHDVVPGERLFDHHEAQVVEQGQVVKVGRRVRVVCIHHEWGVGPDCFTNGRQVIDV